MINEALSTSLRSQDHPIGFDPIHRGSKDNFKADILQISEQQFLFQGETFLGRKQLIHVQVFFMKLFWGNLFHDETRPIK